MTWLDKLKGARKAFAKVKIEVVDDEDIVAIFDALILLTEAVEEVGRHGKVPLVDWDKPHP